MCIYFFPQTLLESVARICVSEVTRRKATVSLGIQTCLALC